MRLSHLVAATPKQSKLIDRLCVALRSKFQAHMKQEIQKALQEDERHRDEGDEPLTAEQAAQGSLPKDWTRELAKKFSKMLADYVQKHHQDAELDEDRFHSHQEDGGNIWDVWFFTYHSPEASPWDDGGEYSDSWELSLDDHEVADEIKKTLQKLGAKLVTVQTELKEYHGTRTVEDSFHTQWLLDEDRCAQIIAGLVNP